MGGGMLDKRKLERIDSSMVVPAVEDSATRKSPPTALAKPSDTERPSPVPLPNGLVLKNGSNARRATSSDMPEPLSVTKIFTVVGDASAVTLTLGVRSSGTACAA